MTYSTQAEGVRRIQQHFGEQDLHSSMLLILSECQHNAIQLRQLRGGMQFLTVPDHMHIPLHGQENGNWHGTALVCKFSHLRKALLQSLKQTVIRMYLVCHTVRMACILWAVVLVRCAHASEIFISQRSIGMYVFFHIHKWQILDLQARIK